MPRQCSVCAHPKKDEIDKALILGIESIDTISSRYELGISSVKRHKASHISAKQEIAVARVETQIAKKEGKSIADQLLDLLDTSKRLLDDCLLDGDRRNALGAIREVRANMELITKLTGELDDSTKVQVNFIKHQYEVFGGDSSGNGKVI